MRRLKLRYLLRFTVLCLTMAIAALIEHQPAWAQDGQEMGPSGIAGGQMVRGAVTAVASDRLTIKTDKGESYQVAVTSNTRVMKDRQPMKIAEIKPGDSVGAMGLLDAPTKTVHALFVMVVDAEQVRKMREGLGKVYIAGKVTAINELNLTIQRPDGVSQVIAVDEGTSFRKGGRQMQTLVNGGSPVSSASDPGPGAAHGESITLADIKVGDSVAGKGELKGGVFVPSELAVMDPSQRQRRRSADGGPSTAAPTAEPNR